MQSNNVNNLRFDINGESYFLHYSRADLPIGGEILPSGSAGITQKGGNTGDALARKIICI